MLKFTTQQYSENITPNTQPIEYRIVDTSLGELLAGSLDKQLCWLSFVNSGRNELDSLQRRFPKHSLNQKQSTQLKQWAEQIAGNTTEDINGEIPLFLKGTDFQYRVWQQLLAIKKGQTLSYSELATNTGNPKASRATGSAVGKNPICIAVPCHRIIRADGGLGGFSGGIDNKKTLLLRENQERWGSKFQARLTSPVPTNLTQAAL